MLDEHFGEYIDKGGMMLLASRLLFVFGAAVTAFCGIPLVAASLPITGSTLSAAITGVGLMVGGIGLKVLFGK